MARALAHQIARLGPWFHNLHLPNGMQTAPDHFLGDFPRFKWEALAPHLPADLTGWRVLDIGCNAGFYSFELARRGATVLGIDLDRHYLRQAKWAARQFGLQDRVTFAQMQVYDLARHAQAYDLVLFLGVFYHLRYPMLALDIVAQRVGRLLVCQTLTHPGGPDHPDFHQADRPIHDRVPLTRPGWPRLAFIEHAFSGDPTNWFLPNPTGMEALLRSAGLRILGQPLDETWLCEPDTARPNPAATWNRSEYRSAIGQPWRTQLADKTEHHGWVHEKPNSGLQAGGKASRTARGKLARTKS